MRTLISTIGWDLRLEIRYQILTVAAIVTALYLVIFRMVPAGNEKLLIALIFSDPAMLGFMFIGALMLFEKGANTLQALVLTPIKPWIYIWSKALSLTVISLVAGITMAIAGHGLQMNYVFLILGIIYASVIFVFVGFLGVVRVKTLNQYIMIVPLTLTPFLLPLLHFFDLVNGMWMYFIPSQAVLILMEGAFQPLEAWELAYGLLYPLPWIGGFYVLARRAYLQYLFK